jgi:hypothetical protein
MSTSSNSTGNPILDNPGVSATVFALVVFFAFVGAIYNSATSHHGEEHGADHKTAPASAH